jgi:hypothetical protein
MTLLEVAEGREEAIVTQAQTGINLVLVTDVPSEDIPEIDDSIPVIEQFWRISKIWNNGQEEGDGDNPISVEEALMTLNLALTRCRDYRLAMRIIQLRQDIVLNQSSADEFDPLIALEQQVYNIHLV